MANGLSLSILFLGGAKRVSMARKFREAATRLGYGCNLYSYELSADVPVACEAEIVVGRRWSDADVVDDIATTCKNLDINILIPFVDGAVEIAAQVAKRVEGLFVPVSSPDICREMFDKIAADERFRVAGLPTPRRFFTEDEFVYPVIAKPRHGSASKGIHILHNANDLTLISDKFDDYIFQEYIGRRQEYTLDCYVSQRGEIIAIVPRLRIEVVGGEVSRTRTIESPEMIDIARRLIESAGLHGAVTIQLIKDLQSGRIMVMEVNPRLGGGAVCSVAAGVDLPYLILEESLGAPLSTQTYRPNTEIARYFSEVVFYK